MAVKTRSKADLYLVGYAEVSITGSKLPSNRQVLAFLIRLHVDKKLIRTDAAAESIRRVADYWKLTGILMLKEQTARE